jgi:Ca2+-binding RTX toxin-like protein
MISRRVTLPEGLMTSCPVTPPGALARPAPACAERLESRTLLSVSLEQGVLTLTGTDGDDQITAGVFTRRSVQAAWRGRWQVLDERSRVRYCEVQVNGEVRRFKAFKIKSVVVHAGAGDDTVILGGDYVTNVPVQFAPRSQPLDADAIVHGGDGADFIVGGGRNDSLYGEGGDDRVFGLRGRDMVDGGDGNDTLGDPCEDRGISLMRGGPGDDILVGHRDAYLSGPPVTFGAQGVPSSLFGRPGNDQFQAGISEVQDLEPGESVGDPPVCQWVH